MADLIEIKIPEMGESISEATIASWFKNEGDFVEEDEALAELETDKVSLELNSPVAGVLTKVSRKTGETVAVKEIVAYVDPSATSSSDGGNSSKQEATTKETKSSIQENTANQNTTLPPAAARVARETSVDASQVEGSGKRGQVLKKDIQAHVQNNAPAQSAAKPAAMVIEPQKANVKRGDIERETVEPMSRLRQAIAKNLVQVQQSAAILTTFNEVNMQSVFDVRNKYKDAFLKKYGVKLGFMSFFTKAAAFALKEVRAINAEIRGTDVIYKNYYDIGVAVGGPKGLVVPVIRDADALSFSQIELEIMRLANKVKDGKIDLSDLQGGTFTITNGGIYGSMMSTPILNPPQSGILGMHNIVKRAVVENDEIVIRPMMYLALTYDHRIVDGKEAVTFLVKIKEIIEDPARLLLEV